MGKSAVAILLFVLPACSATWTFPAGAPVLAKSGGIAFPMDDTAYAKFVEQTKASGHTIPIVKKPPNLSPDARLGYNFVVGGKNRGWILDGDDTQGWRLYLDWNGDGDLSHAEPRKMERIDAVSRLDVQVTDGDLRWPCRFEVIRLKVEGKEQLGVQIIVGTTRSGVIELDGHRYPFRLSGTHGRYDGEYDRISVDRFGDGAPDSYKIPDQYLNLAGKSYEFTVHPLGASLMLIELAESRPDRPSLKLQSAAPDFSASDIEGVARPLAGYRGHTLLLEFWSTSCGPCRAEAPRMVELYRILHADKIEFLGVSSDDSLQTLRAFLDEFHLAWPQIREPFAGPLHQLYRVAGEPSYFLIGPAGQILDAWLGSGETTARVNKALAAR